MKKTALLFTLLFLLSGPRFCFSLDWKTLHEKADREDVKSALSTVKLNPASIDDLYVLGLVYLNAHENKQAQETFNNILKIDPGNLEAKWGVATSLYWQHKMQDSERLLRDVTAKDAAFFPAYVTLASIKFTYTDFSTAARLALIVIHQGRKNVDTSNYARAYTIYAAAKGMIAYYGGFISKTINGTAVFPSLKKAWRLKPDSPVVTFGMGSFYLLAPGYAGGDLNKARAFLEETIRLDPLFADAYVRLGQYYKAKGGNEEYMLYMKKALQIDPQNELALDISNGDCKFICIGAPNPNKKNQKIP